MLLKTGTTRIVEMIGKDVIVLESRWRAYSQNETILQNNGLFCKLDNCIILFFCLFLEL